MVLLMQEALATVAEHDVSEEHLRDVNEHLDGFVSLNLYHPCDSPYFGEAGVEVLYCEFVGHAVYHTDVDLRPFVDDTLDVD